MRDYVYELDGLAIGMATNSLARDTVSGAAREIERLRAALADKGEPAPLEERRTNLAHRIEQELCNGSRQFTLRGAEIDWVIAALRRSYEKTTSRDKAALTNESRSESDGMRAQLAEAKAEIARLRTMLQWSI